MAAPPPALTREAARRSNKMLAAVQLIFMSLMTVATEMIVAWDHGVLSVVFSVL